MIGLLVPYIRNGLKLPPKLCLSASEGLKVQQCCPRDRITSMPSFLLRRLSQTILEVDCTRHRPLCRLNQVTKSYQRKPMCCVRGSELAPSIIRSKFFSFFCLFYLSDVAGVLWLGSGGNFDSERGFHQSNLPDLCGQYSFMLVI